MKLRDARAGVALILLAAAGALTAGAFSPVAQAWDVNGLPAGFTASNTFDAGAKTCQSYYVIAAVAASAVSGHLCTDSPTFQHDVDAFVDAHVCAVNPAADPALCSPTTSTQSTSTTTVVITTPAAPATTTTPATTTQPADTTTSAAPAASAPPAPAVSTVTVTTATDVAAALTLIQQRLDWLEFRVKALEDEVGQIIGEEKNETPFTNPA